MGKRKVLLHIDGDVPASTFDAIVAIDAGAEQILSFAGAQAEQIAGIVSGAMFTRGPHDLHNTAIFVGGSDVDRAEALCKQAQAAFFGPFRVSILCDPNGANTTAASAVILASSHVDIAGQTALVLGGTGPVGSRIAMLLGRGGAKVLLASRTFGRAQRICQQHAARVPGGQFVPTVCGNASDTLKAIAQSQSVFAAGAAGVEFVGEGWLDRSPDLGFAADVNAIAPLGLAGIESADSGKRRGKTICYGALGVGALKMKLHKECLRRIFERNDLVLDIEEVFQIGQNLK